MSVMASQITSLTIVYSTFIQAQIKENIKVPRHWLCEGIHRWPVNSPHKGPVMWKMFPFDDVIMTHQQKPISDPIQQTYKCNLTKINAW